MGMFDYVKLDLHIPELDVVKIKDDEFQTKSLDNFMDNYRIDSNGQLWRRFVVREEVPLEERPLYKEFYGTDKWNEWYAVCGSIREVPGSEVWEPWPWHGHVEIHGQVSKETPQYDWVEVDFLFESGKVKSHVVSLKKYEDYNK